MNQETTAIEPEVTQLVKQAPAFMSIKTMAQAESVVGYLKLVRELRKRIDDFFAPMQDGAHKAWKAIVNRHNELDAKPAEIENACRRMLSVWQDKEREAREAEQKRLDEQARQAAIATALAEGDKRQAKAIETGKVAVTSAVVVQQTTKVSGVSASITWQADITDKMQLIKAVAQGKASITFLEPNMSAINSVVRSCKGQVTIAGVQVRKLTGIRSTGR